MVKRANLAFVDSFDYKAEAEGQDDCNHCEFYEAHSGKCTFEDDVLFCKFDIYDTEDDTLNGVPYYPELYRANRPTGRPTA